MRAVGAWGLGLARAAGRAWPRDGAADTQWSAARFIPTRPHCRCPVGAACSSSGFSLVALLWPFWVCSVSGNRGRTETIPSLFLLDFEILAFFSQTQVSP